MRIDLLHKKYASLISQMPGYFLLKSCESRYVAFSPQFSPLLGWKTQEDCLDKLDADLPCQASEMSDIFVQEDKNTLKKGETKQLHLTKYCDDNARIFITNKKVLLSDSGEKIGLIVYDEDVTSNQAIQNIVMNEVIRFNKKDKYSLKMKISSHYEEFGLSERESTIFFYLLRNKKSKYIATLLNISTRTVEKHIENITAKLNCTSRSQILELSESKKIQHTLINSIFKKSMRLDFK